MKLLRFLLVFGLILLLSGCRVELYSALSEEDANQMLAILMQHNISAEKQAAEGGVTLRVEKSQFINAVELLRLNGFPRRSYTSVDTMFPPNQLVVSPAEEHQKIIFLNEQRIEEMLSKIDGVVCTDVTIGSHVPDDMGDNGNVSVAVFIKYSPQINLEAFRVQIKNLIEKSIPGIHADQIGILMQPTEFRMHSAANVPDEGPWRTIQWLAQHRWPLILALTLVIFILVSLMLVAWRKRR
ncbi:EscJ/YscJ/HrcJ family type III secretion inner membrane ring protein SsaJ [Lonsdalea quercina]|uniref:EscJ/YscJ/HrcJ family type III secretion inner membrane ring protein SsaJ n=1 Tax=Lonsdalea quercina TaxID=71657 RepID=UPI0039749EA9